MLRGMQSRIYGPCHQKEHRFDRFGLEVAARRPVRRDGGPVVVRIIAANGGFRKNGWAFHPLPPSCVVDQFFTFIEYQSDKKVLPKLLPKSQYFWALFH